MKKQLISILVVLTAVFLYAGTSITDSTLGISITLPDNWIMDSGDGTHSLFWDTTRTYAAIVAIERYNFSPDTIYQQSDDWTRANFIAYSFVVDADPVSSMLFYDTVSSRQNEGPWSTEAFSVFYDPTTSSGDVAEYIRFTAAGTFGYEIYAIGPLDDMNEHVGMYATIIQGVTILSSVGVSTVPASFYKNPNRFLSVSPSFRYDLLGRSVKQQDIRRISGMVAGPGRRFCLFR